MVGLRQAAMAAALMLPVGAALPISAYAQAAGPQLGVAPPAGPSQLQQTLDTLLANHVNDLSNLRSGILMFSGQLAQAQAQVTELTKEHEADKIKIDSLETEVKTLKDGPAAAPVAPPPVNTPAAHH